DSPYSLFFFSRHRTHRHPHSFPTRRSSDLPAACCPVSPKRHHAPRSMPSFARRPPTPACTPRSTGCSFGGACRSTPRRIPCCDRSEEHTSELQSLAYLVCRLLLEKKKQTID